MSPDGPHALEAPMKRFEQHELREALAHAAAGGQALHLHRVIPDEARAPRCFVLAVRRGGWLAHLIDLDPGRLRRTARSLGVRVVRPHRGGTAWQHLDLCGAPLRRALALCDEE